MKKHLKELKWQTKNVLRHVWWFIQDLPENLFIFACYAMVVLAFMFACYQVIMN